MPKYVFRGRLCGTICGDCLEPLSNVTFASYRLRADQDATSLAVADPKKTLAVLTDAEVQAKQSSLLGEFQADANGAFTATFGERYQGEAFEIDVYCGNVPHGPPRPHHGPVQFSVTTLQPQWRPRDDVCWPAGTTACLPASGASSAPCSTPG